MGKAISLMKRPIQRMNIENRAHKVIGREKPVPAPQHKSTKKQLEIAKAANPTFLDVHRKKDAGLDERLKNIYVQSHEAQMPDAESNPDRPLPLLTKSGNDFEYGFWEPKEAAEGRCTLRTAMTFMADYLEDPVKNSAEVIAKKYVMDVRDVANILEYFRVFKVVVPDGDRQLAYMERKEIPSPKQKEQ